MRVRLSVKSVEFLSMSPIPYTTDCVDSMKFPMPRVALYVLEKQHTEHYTLL